MYIQAQTDRELQLPQNYSGNTFRPQAENSPTPEPPPSVQDAPAEDLPEQAPPEEAVAAGSFFEHKGERCDKNDRGRGLFSSLSPLLSSFLPPGCEKRAEHGQWRDLVLIGVAVLLFLREDSDDLLPLLLLRLLWD